MTKQITFITALHGNERMPVLALASIGQSQIVANPLALSQCKRIVNIDMSQAFGKEGDAYEIKRAKEILASIDEGSFVIDFHTTSAKSEPFAIVVDKSMISFAKTLGLKHIVYMKYNVKGGNSLIDHCNGVAVEAGEHEDPRSFEVSISIVENALKGIKEAANIYEVYDVIKEPGEYENFILHNSGFIPVLAGSRAYDFYGMKARLI